MNWKEKAILLLEKSLTPIPQELNEIDWKGGLSDDKERLACYQHCCLMFADRETMNNQSVRERFGINKNQSTIASHIIGDAVEKGLIKSANPESESRKFVSYVPFYA